MEKKIKIFTDGASRGNPGPAGIGIVIFNSKEDVIQTFKKYIGECTNNVAEYTALSESIKLLKNSKEEFDEINFYSDSELMIKQITGNYRIKNKDLIRLSLEFWKEIKLLNKKFSVTHISRDKNKKADKLANQAIDENTAEETDRSLLIKN